MNEYSSLGKDSADFTPSVNASELRAHHEPVDAKSQTAEDYELREGGPVRRELREVFDPLSALASARIEKDIVANPAEVREVLADGQISSLPYGDSYVDLPADLFEGGPSLTEFRDSLAGMTGADRVELIMT